MAQRQSITIGDGDALSVTDVQIDFLPGGALGVPDGDKVITPLNRIIALFHKRRRPIVFTRDWHPANHCSFRPQGGPWPVHCVQNTPGAAFSPDLNLPPDSIVVSKAVHPDSEEYSTLHARDAAGHTEDGLMWHYGVRRVFIGGLATEYCVLNTVRDAIKEGFSVLVLADAIQAVNVKPGDGEQALAEMRSLGAHMILSTDLA